MTNQEVLDKNIEWFLVQKNPPSINGNKSCMYWYAEGTLRCAVGCAIKPEDAKILAGRTSHSSHDASLYFHGQGVPVPKVTRFLAERYPGVATEFWIQMQEAHDDTACDEDIEFYSGYRARLKMLADAWQLKFEVPEEVKA